MALLVVGMIPVPAWSQTDDRARDGMETVSVVLDARTCLGLAEVTGGQAVVPADGGAYQPGVDARGRPVVPAEGPGGAQDWDVLPEPLEIEVVVELGGRYGAALPSGSDLPIGRVEIRDGRAWFNGRPMAGEDREALWQACRKMGLLGARARQGKPAAP